MLNRSKEAKTEKYNDQLLTIQTKTKYINIPTINSVDENSYSPKKIAKPQTVNQRHHYNKPIDNAQAISFRNQYNLEASPQNATPFGVYNQKNNYNNGEAAKISTNGYLEVDYKRNLRGNDPKNSTKKNTIQNSLQINGKLLQISHSHNFKKENAKKNGLQMKMNKIDSISDQITSLLKMVTENKLPSRSNNNKFVSKFQEIYQNRNKEHSLQNYQPKNNKSLLRNTPMQQSQRRYLNRQARERAYTNLDSEFQQSFDSIKLPNKKSPVGIKEQNRPLHQFKPRGGTKYSPHSFHGNQKYLQDRILEKVASPYSKQHSKSVHYKIQPYQERQYQNEVLQSIQMRKKQQANFYDRYYLKNQRSLRTQTINEGRRENKKYEQYTPKYIKNKQKDEYTQNQLLPLSIQNRSQQTKGADVQRQSVKVQEHLQKLKQKVRKSQQKNQRQYQNIKNREQDLNNLSQKSAGKLYYKHEHKSQFQLNLLPVQVDKPNTIKVAQKLAQQSEIDKQLTLPKIQFQKQEDQGKWNQLEKCLKAKQISMTTFQIQKLLELAQQEINFNKHHFRSSNNTKNIADLLSQAQQHWSRQICGCVTTRGLKAQHFSAQSLSLDKDGKLFLQDLANFINTYTGNQYFTRDLIMIYRRLQLLQGSRNDEAIQFSTLLRVLTT